MALLTGTLPDGRTLRQPMIIVVEHGDDEVVVSEPEFHMHAAAPTDAEATAAFRRIISGYLDVLGDREGTLGPALQAQLAYLRDYITTP